MNEPLDPIPETIPETIPTAPVIRPRSAWQRFKQLHWLYEVFLGLFAASITGCWLVFQVMTLVSTTHASHDLTHLVNTVLILGAAATGASLSYVIAIFVVRNNAHRRQRLNRIVAGAFIAVTAISFVQVLTRPKPAAHTTAQSVADNDTARVLSTQLTAFLQGKQRACTIPDHVLNDVVGQPLTIAQSTVNNPAYHCVFEVRNRSNMDGHSFSDVLLPADTTWGNNAAIATVTTKNEQVVVSDIIVLRCPDKKSVCMIADSVRTQTAQPR